MILTYFSRSPGSYINLLYEVGVRDMLFFILIQSSIVLRYPLCKLHCYVYVLRLVYLTQELNSGNYNIFYCATPNANLASSAE